MRSSTPRNLPAREFVAALSSSLWAAAAAARWLSGRVHNTPKLEERLPSKQALTEADCVCQEVLLMALREHYPWIELDAEEDTPAVQAFRENRAEYRAIIDPIDGTLHYLDQDGVYAVLVGLERHGRVEAALVALPEADLVIRAVRGEGCELAHAGGPFRPVRVQSAGSRLLISKALGATAQDSLRAAGYELMAASGGAIGVAPQLSNTSAAVRVSDSAEGLSRRTWVSTLATLEAGGVVETLSGEFPLCYEPGVRGIVVAHDRKLASELRCRVSAGD